MTASDRLRWAREHAGFASGSDAARALNVPEPTYLAHENGSRGFARRAERYARRYRVDLNWLMTGRGEPLRGYNESEEALVEAFRKLPPSEAQAYLRLLLSRTGEA